MADEYRAVDEEAVVVAALRLVARRSALFEGGPWLAESPPRFEEPPVCIGCGVEGNLKENSMWFVHADDCPAFDLAVALGEPMWSLRPNGHG